MRKILVLVVSTACAGATVGLGSDVERAQTGAMPVDAGGGGGPGGCGGGGGRAAVAACEGHVDHACLGPVPNASDPLISMPTPIVVHWDVCTDCIMVTVDPRLHQRISDLRDALDVWTCGAAGALCFYGPLETAEPGLLHVTDRADSHEPPVSPALQSLASVTADLTTGRVSSATIYLDPSASRSELGLMVGCALGFEIVSSGDTIMCASADAGLVLSASDVGTVRALYGQTPFCR